MWALTADADFLAQRGQGQVEQVFARAVNIALPARQQLLTLLCEEYDNAPNSCRLALTHFNGLFRHDDKVQFDDQGITIGQHHHIEMSHCQRWLSPTLQMTAVNFHLIAWQQWYGIIHQHLGENETLFNYRGDNPFYQALNKELHIKRRAVIQAVNDKQNIASAVASMMGLGIGLTPSADDYLTGLVLILFISGHPAEKYKEEFYLGLQRGRNNTTLLSAITLEAALQQRCRENIHRFIHNIIYDIPGNATQAIEKIKHIGSSSGCDMLYGMADGCALSQTYGGNYVS
ncbi:DUF2877 domain-containing protein [Escherichia coli]|uniref:DUF2877 domain-containing protein n=1 Tax=Escherichia coli TaxID=562 RepID=UPI0027380CE3|nr:DUF2877 domain-containing protein [Escherichia coli]MDP4338554.1 DUF2877 domain-containing protein [Escherichia coli]MDP4399047.1 DUF2877 domain-containing protein [Escherichia coli]